MTILSGDDQLCRLLYTSGIAPSVRVEERETLVTAIAQESVERNERSGITGGLVFVDECFIQILEGPRAELERTFERICRDFRHSEVRLVDYVTVTSRAFPGWSMACLSAGAEASLAVKGELHELRFLVGTNARQAMQLMQRLVATHCARETLDAAAAKAAMPEAADALP